VRRARGFKTAFTVRRMPKAFRIAASVSRHSLVLLNFHNCRALRKISLLLVSDSAAAPQRRPRYLRRSCAFMRAKSTTCCAISFNCLPIAASRQAPSASNTLVLVLIATPTGVGQPRSA